MVVEPGAPVSVEDVEPGPLGPRDARVRVDASGVCRTDLSMVQRVRFPMPCILGHEGAGTVVEIGSDVSRVRIGDRVIASFVPKCGHCFYCARGQSTQCEAMMPKDPGRGLWGSLLVAVTLSRLVRGGEVPATCSTKSSPENYLRGDSLPPGESRASWSPHRAGSFEASPNCLPLRLRIGRDLTGSCTDLRGDWRW
jgi:Alcohol dehydrogenase GroES-like domain